MRAVLGEDFIYIYGTYSTPTLSGMNEKPKSTEDETLLKDGLVARDGTLQLDLGCLLQASLPFMSSFPRQEKKGVCGVGEMIVQEESFKDLAGTGSLFSIRIHVPSSSSLVK